jgi:hypothetical protein
MGKMNLLGFGFLLGLFSIMLALIPEDVVSGETDASLLRFTEVAEDVGLYHRGETWGWSIGDFDDDGYVDLFLANHPEQGLPDTLLYSYLMHNEGGIRFTDVITGSGISYHEDRHDEPWVDYDNDGDLDLFVSIGGRGGSAAQGPNQLWEQVTSGVFTDVAQPVKVDYPDGRGRGMVWLDYDLDNDLDFFFTSAPVEETGLNAFFRNLSGIFSISSQPHIDPSSGSHTNVSVADYDNDGDPDIYVTDETALYRNDGLLFSAVQDSAGVASGAVQASDWGDYDNDGDLDLFLTRGRTDLGADFWKISENEIKFVGRAEADEDGLDITVNAGGNLTFYLQERAGGTVTRDTYFIYIGDTNDNPGSNPFTITFGDTSQQPAYTPNLSEGFYIWQSVAGTYHIRWSGPQGQMYRFSGIITTDTTFADVSPYMIESISVSPLSDQLFQNQGDGTFIDIAAVAGVDDQNDSRGADWGDFDNDGDLDLFVQKFGLMDENIPNRLYLNNGDGTFTDVASQVGVTGDRIGAGWGALWADYNNDGFLDLLTSQATWPWPLETGSYELFHNEGNDNHWMMIDLRGVTSNSRGLGAKIYVTVGGETQYREYADNSHYFNHYSGPVHFGLGQATLIDIIRIEWPSGQIDEFYNLPVNRRFTVNEGSELDIWINTYIPMMVR